MNQGCQRHCYQLEIITECGCFYPKLPVENFRLQIDTGMKSCNITPDETSRKLK